MEQKTDLTYGHWFRFYSVLKHLSLNDFNGNLHYVIKTFDNKFKRKRWFKLIRVRIQKRVPVSCSTCKGQHFKKKMGKNSCF